MPSRSEQSQPDPAATSPSPTSTSEVAFDSNSFETSRPFFVLGVDSGADAETVRARYLELVRQYPPDRDPAMFARIRHAYESASDPIVYAQRLVELSRAEPRRWDAILDDNQSRPPRLPTELLLSLGNRRQAAKTDTAASNENES